MKVKELWTDESKWTKGWNARTSDNRPVGIYDSIAVKWCLLGAIHKCYGSLAKSVDIEQKVIKHIFDKYGSTAITDFNDYNGFIAAKNLVEELNI